MIRFFQIIDAFVKNLWIIQYLALVALVLLSLAIISRLSKSFKAAYEGFKELFTIRGMIAALIVGMIIFVVWKGLMSLNG